MNNLYHQPHWYAIYTHSRHEKKVAEELADRDVTCFLPLREVRHRWKDRWKLVQLPLFSGYVFVNIPLADKLKVLKTKGTAYMVGLGGHPEPIPDEQIYSIMSFLEKRVPYDSYPYLKEGEKVEVRYGPLKGLRGILVRKKNQSKLVLSVDLIQQSIALEVDASDVEPVNGLTS